MAVMSAARPNRHCTVFALPFPTPPPLPAPLPHTHPVVPQQAGRRVLAALAADLVLHLAVEHLDNARGWSRGRAAGLTLTYRQQYRYSLSGEGKGVVCTWLQYFVLYGSPYV